jgi:hypothetical protein
MSQSYYMQKAGQSSAPSMYTDIEPKEYEDGSICSDFGTLETDSKTSALH